MLLATVDDSFTGFSGEGERKKQRIVNAREMEGEF